MSTELTQAGDCTASITLLEPGSNTKKRASDGSWNLSELVSEIKIIESISSPTIRGELTIFDATDFINTLYGNDLWKIDLTAGGIKHSYILQCYEISARVRQEKKEAYVINLVSPEFIVNETLNVFGAFKAQDGSLHVKEILEDQFKNKKKLYLEKTKKVRFTVPNWRPFDTINYLATKVVRSSSTGDVEQGAFAFYENARGFNFKSLDQMVEDITSQGEKPTYVYGPKNLDDDALKKQYLIDKVTFPTSFNALKNLRQGTWSGYVIGLDPSSLAESTLPTKDQRVAASTSYYSIEKMFKHMSHLEKKGHMPLDIKNSAIRSIVTAPKRIKYKCLPIHLWDMPKAGNQTQVGGKTLEKTMDTTKYNFLRKKSLEAIQLQVEVPGNLGLYAGEGIKVELPRMQAKNDKIELDKMYSGTYMIGGVVHHYKVTNLQTSLHLLKDSVKVTK